MEVRQLFPDLCARGDQRQSLGEYLGVGAIAEKRRGVVLSFSAKADSAASDRSLGARSIGKKWRSRPLLFSMLPCRQGLYGS